MRLTSRFVSHEIILPNKLILNKYQEVDANIRHEAVPVPTGSCPFDHTRLLLFEQGLNLLQSSGDLPQGYGVTAVELGGNDFDEQEHIPIGLQKKGFQIQLSSEIWKPRTEIWAQGLYVMNSILAAVTVSH